jgi:hypothetical protein
VWLSGTDFTVPNLVVAAFAKANHRMLGTAYSSGSCKLAAALPQKSVRTVFQLTASYYYYALVLFVHIVLCPIFVIICHKNILLLFQILLFLVACFRSGLILLYILCQISVSILYCLSCICQFFLVYFLAIQHSLF